MKNQTIGFLVLLMLAGSTFMGTAQTRAARNTAAKPVVGLERPFQPSVRNERTLPNGLQVIVVRRPTVPKVSVLMTIKAGTAADPEALTGLADVTADAIQEGTRTRTSQQIRQQAFAMGGSLSATVTQDYTTISSRALAEFTPSLLDLMADIVMNPTFPESEVAIIKAQRLQTLQQQKASPQFAANREFRRALFGAHPYARVSGSEATIGALDAGRLREFHTTYYRPNQAFLLVVGDVTPAAVFAAAGKSFGAWARRDIPARPAGVAVPAVARSVEFVQRPNSVQTSISVGNLAVKRSDPRWFELTLANTIFGGAFNSRIVRNLREEKGYTYAPFSSFAAYAEAGLYHFSADVRNEVTGATLKEIFAEMNKFRAEGSDGEELKGAKQYQRGLYAIRTALQAGLAAELNQIYVYGLPRDYVETYQSKISAITPAQVRSAAQTLLEADRPIIVMVGDYAKVKDQLGEYKDMHFVDLDGKRIDPPSAIKTPEARD